MANVYFALFTWVKHSCHSGIHRIIVVISYDLGWSVSFILTTLQQLFRHVLNELYMNAALENNQFANLVEYSYRRRPRLSCEWAACR